MSITTLQFALIHLMLRISNYTLTSMSVLTTFVTENSFYCIMLLRVNFVSWVWPNSETYKKPQSRTENSVMCRLVRPVAHNNVYKIYVGDDWQGKLKYSKKTKTIFPNKTTYIALSIGLKFCCVPTTWGERY